MSARLAIVLGVAGVGLAIALKRSHASRRMTPTELRALIARETWPNGITPDALILMAKVESNYNPADKTGTHRGLWQLAPESVDDYNAKHGTKLRAQDLHDPAKSLPIVADHFATLARSYAEVGITPDHPDYIPLVYAGHNMGYSRARGLARLYELAGGLDQVEDIAEAYKAHADQLIKFLGWPKKQAYINDFARQWRAMAVGLNP